MVLIPYVAGGNAYLAGKPNITNPYVVGTSDWYDWEIGYVNALIDDTVKADDFKDDGTEHF